MEKSEQPAERVTGIGGVFFKAKDPGTLAQWYKQNLGLPVEGTSADFLYSDSATKQSGRTVWSTFPADTDYFGASASSFMLNYKVPNLDRMLAQLRRAGVEVVKVEDYAFGRFAWITDPEGNRVELWEPKGD